MSRRVVWKRAAPVLALVGVLLLAACTRPEEEQQKDAETAAPQEAEPAAGTGDGGAAGEVLTFVVAGEPPSYDGHRETTFATVHPVAPHYSLLVKVDPADPKAQAIVGDLARDWTVSEDGRTYTFRLHEGVRFHDGSALTAEDVVASLRKIVFPPEGVVSAREPYFRMVESITAEDPHTVVIRLEFATPAFLPALAQPFNFIYSADKLAEDPRWYEDHVMGSGPFRFVEYSPGAYWRGERFEDYFREGLPRLAGFEAIFAPKESVRLQAIRGGRAMVEFRGLSPQGRDDLVRARGEEIRVQESPWNCGLFVVPNHTRPPFDDPRVRRALSLALDRWGGSDYLSQIAIVKTVGGVVFPDHPLAMSAAELSEVPGYWKDLERSRAEARRLLKAAGVEEGFSFRLNNRGVDQPYKIVGTWLIDQWRQIGLDVEQRVQPTGPYLETLRAKPPEFDVSIDYNCQAVVNPTLDVSKFLSDSPTNSGGYTDEKLDALFERQLRETDRDKQAGLMHRFERRLLGEQAHYIMTFWWHRIIAHDARVQGWHISPSHYLNQDLAGVWIEE